MKASSAKAKGRKLQNAIAQDIRDTFDLPAEDVTGAVMGESGMDIKLSATARAVFPFAVEAKCQERLNIWSALGQSADNTPQGLTPIVVFSRNRAKTYVALEWTDFLSLVEG